MRFEKKAWPEYYEAISSGKKKYDLRLADWECKEGDVLLLREWDPEIQEYTGREIEKKVTYVAKFKIDDMFFTKEDIEKYGIQVMSIE